MPSGLPPAAEKPLWIPSQDRIDRANLSRFMRFVRNEIGNADLNSYAPLYRLSVDQPAVFWTLLWDFVGIRGSGDRTPVLVAEDGMDSARWFPGVNLNFAQNLLRFDDDRAAIRCHGLPGERETLTYAQLQRRVAEVSAAFRARGVVAGDLVAAVVSNVPDTLVAMLATASIGAVWFGCPAASARDGLMQSLTPAILLVDDDAALAGLSRAEVGTVVRLDEAPSQAGSSAIPLQELIAPFAGAEIEFSLLPFDHPLYLTVATTHDGATELLVHGAGGTLMQHLKELVLHVDLKREDKVFFHADNQAMAWYWLASSLAIGSTLVLHAGDALAPSAPTLWDLVDEYGITVLGLHSQWLNAAAESGVVPRESHRLLALKSILTAGAPLRPESYDFVYGAVKKRVFLAPISTGGDTLACFALGAPMLPVQRGEIACRGLGMRVEVLDADGEPVIGEVGDLVCSAPFPSMPLGFIDDPGQQRFVAAYFSRQAERWCGGERALLTARESLVLHVDQLI